MNKRLSMCFIIATMLLITLFSCNNDSDGGFGNNIIGVKPIKMDLKNAKGFAIAESTDGGRSISRGDNQFEDIVEDPYALYNIDANGNITMTVFYYEIVVEEGKGNSATKEKVQHELSDVLQIIPTVISDLGKYIVFSGCTSKINKKELSEEAYSACEFFIRDLHHKTYLVRKSDGSMFDLSDKTLFTYHITRANHLFTEYEEIYQSYIDIDFEKLATTWVQVVPETYYTSTNNNFFTASFGLNALPCPYIYKLVDKNGAIDVVEYSQPLINANIAHTFLTSMFIVDKNENAYFCEKNDFDSNPSPYVEVYFANGTFNSIQLGGANDKIAIESMQIDENGNPYIVYFKKTATDDLYIVVGELTDGTYHEVASQKIDQTIIDTFQTREKTTYMGFINGAMWWHNNFNCSISFNPLENTVNISDFTNNIADMLSNQYDGYIASAQNAYATKVVGNNVKVKEYNIVTQGSREYDFNVNLSNIVSQTYKIINIQNEPNLIINGRSTSDGTYASFRINLITGDNNATFSTDDRKVITFYKIN